MSNLVHDDERHERERHAGRQWPSFLVLVACLAICFVAAGIGSALTLPQIPTWYEGLVKPWFNPPNTVFGPVWTILYALMAVAMWRVWMRSSGDVRTRAAGIFALQLALNVAWSAVFFAAHSPGAGLIVIVALLAAIIATIFVFTPIDRLAAWLFAPYLAWVSFASVLNGAVFALN